MAVQAYFYPSDRIVIDGQTHYIGRIGSLRIKKDDSCIVHPALPNGFTVWACLTTVLLNADKTRQFVEQFLQAWDQQHRARLLTDDIPATLHYNANEKTWTFHDKSGRSILGVLTHYLGQHQTESLSNQIQRIIKLIGPIMGYQIAGDSDFSSHLLMDSIDESYLQNLMLHSQTIKLAPRKPSHCSLQ